MLLGEWCSPLREGGAIGGNQSSGGFEVEKFSARTVDEALAEASAKLGLPARELTYEIRDPGASGFLGIGSRPATIAVRATAPNKAASLNRSNADTYVVSPGDGRDVSAHPPENRPRGASAPERPGSEVPPERRATPSDRTQDLRVVMEAAQRLGTPMRKIRQRVAAGELMYDPDERRLVEATPKAFEEDDASVAVGRVENLDTEGSASAEYLTVPEAARELGESVTDVLGRIGKRELPCERISGVVKVRRQAVLAIKAGRAPMPRRSSQSAGQESVSERTEARNGGSELETAAINRIEELQERAAMLEEELRALRKELEEERSRRQQRDEWIADLRSKLEERDPEGRRSEKAPAPGRRAASAPSRSPGYAARAGGLALYPWQREALDWWQKRGYRGVVEAVTGAGKTRLAIATIAQQVGRGGPAVVVVPTRDLLHQWKRELERWLVGELGLPINVGLLGANRKDTLDNYDVIVSTAQSGSRNTLLPRGTRGLLVADEVHHYGARRWSQVLEKGFDRRLGLTATYEREDSGIERFLDPYFGEGVFPVDYARALADDVIAPFKIAFVAVRFSGEERRRYEEHDEKASKYRRKLVKGYGLPEEPFGEFMREVSQLAIGGEGEATGLARAYLNAFSKRRQTLAGAREKFKRVADLSAAVQKADRSILFAQTQEAATRAVRQLTECGINGAVLTSSMDMSERKKVFASFEDGEHELVAAPRLLDEGVDVPAADLAIVLASSRSRRQMVQRMGRVVRKKRDGRLARLAVLYVVGTSEDPEVAHEDFLYLVTKVARDIVYFGPKATPQQICAYLNDWGA